MFVRINEAATVTAQRGTATAVGSSLGSVHGLRLNLEGSAVGDQLEVVCDGTNYYVLANVSGSVVSSA